MSRLVRTAVLLCLMLAALPAATATAGEPRLAVDFNPDTLSAGPNERVVTSFDSNHNGTRALYVYSPGFVLVRRVDGRLSEGRNRVSLGTLPQGEYLLRLEAHYNGQEDGDTQRISIVRSNTQTELRVSFKFQYLLIRRPAKAIARFSSTLGGRGTLILRPKGSTAIVRRFDRSVRRGTNKVNFGKLPVGDYVLTVQGRLNGRSSLARQTILVR